MGAWSARHTPGWRCGGHRGYLCTTILWDGRFGLGVVPCYGGKLTCIFWPQYTQMQGTQWTKQGTRKAVSMCRVGTYVVPNWKNNSVFRRNILKTLVGRPGFEPGPFGSEPKVLPLNYPPPGARPQAGRKLGSARRPVKHRPVKQRAVFAIRAKSGIQRRCGGIMRDENAPSNGGLIE